jgi:GNAT superfamily N-acetyltransferase
MNVQYADVSEKDVASVLDMMARFYAIDGYPFEDQVSRENMRLLIANENLGKAWLILNDEDIIGYVVLTFCFSFVFRGRTAVVDELFLEERYRGKGIGGQVMDFIDAQAQALNLNALHLEVERHNEKGKKLYVKKGFKEHERILMTKKLI